MSNHKDPPPGESILKGITSIVKTISPKGVVEGIKSGVDEGVKGVTGSKIVESIKKTKAPHHIQQKMEQFTDDILLNGNGNGKTVKEISDQLESETQKRIDEGVYDL